MMDILTSETCWAHKKWNKIASDIKLVFYSSTITMMHGPINIKKNLWASPVFSAFNPTFRLNIILFFFAILCNCNRIHPSFLFSYKIWAFSGFELYDLFRRTLYTEKDPPPHCVRGADAPYAPRTKWGSNSTCSTWGIPYIRELKFLKNVGAFSKL